MRADRARQKAEDSALPFLFENWKASIEGMPVLNTSEHILFSDAWITSEFRFGPYQLINTVAHGSVSSPGALLPVIVLRADNHVEQMAPVMDKTDVSTFHGGWLVDEVAALVSLALGIRMRGGPLVRVFDGKDPKGRPVAYEGRGRGTPLLLTSRHGTVLPGATGTHCLDELRWIGDWFDTASKNCVALIRAARMYEVALWTAEGTPEMAWLFLVSAIETAAECCDISKSSDVDRLRESKPELVRSIEGHCPDLLEMFASQLASLTGSTRKFVAFTTQFLPPPPASRPPEAFQAPWQPDDLKKALRQIYKYRSLALHSGVPFPVPMCEAPRLFSRECAAVEEVPAGLATHAMGGTWLAKDTPMLLHVFEYIVRSALKSWWSSLNPRGAHDLDSEN